MSKKFTCRSVSAMLMFAGASVFALAPGLVAAQETADVGEVVVTASRIQSAGFTAPTPTTVLGVADLARRAPANIIEAINDVPSFKPSSTPQQSSGSNGLANAGAGAAQVDLRGLGSARTLTLLNGRRLGGGDLNQIPTILTQRVDVVTGGASAAYGSDAVAGVVNIVLDTRFNGLKGTAQYGVTKYGDDKTFTGSLAGGADLFGGKGHILVGGEYSNGKGAYTDDLRRSWVADRRGVTITNPNYRTNGLSPFINADNYNFSTMNPGGLITAGPLKGITFDNGGVPRPFQYGSVVIGNAMIGGELTDPGIYNLRPDLERYALFSRLDLTLTSRIKTWAELSNSQVTGKALALAPRDQGNLTIRSDNPFIPASIRAQMTAQNQTTLTMGRVSMDVGQAESTNRTDVYRVATGLDGELGGSWNWDAYYQYSEARGDIKIEGSRIEANWLRAIDAVSNAQGVPVCRSTLTAPTNGCVPFNIFGPNAGSSAARSYVTGTQTNDSFQSLNIVAANVRGEPVSTWAGPVALAVGAEYRSQRIDNTSDPISLARGFNVGNTQPLSGKLSVKEAYAEVAAPLAKDMAFAKSLDLNAAVRRTDYSVSGGVTTWKIGGVWEPTSDLLIRATRSRDIRAPSIAEFFSPGNTQNNNVRQIRGPTAGISNLIPITGGGNTLLRPEKADTFTAGFSYRPRWARLRFSADYFSIKIKDQIGNAGIDLIVNRCEQGSQEFCNYLTFNAAGTIIAAKSTNVNNNRFTTRGLDLEASYIQPLGEISSALRGTLTGRAFATRVFEYSTTDEFGTIDRAGQNAPILAGSAGMTRWQATYILTYELSRFSSSITWRYLAPGVLEATSITGTATERFGNKVSSYTTVNLAASYLIIDNGRRRLQLFGAVNNVFNKGTPSPINPLGTTGFNYDSLGTVYRAGLRFAY